nr:hypothetical protein [uncultured Capnocytophaga sp.]
MSLIMTTSFLLFKAGTTFTYDIVMIMAVMEAMLYDKDFFQQCLTMGIIISTEGIEAGLLGG